MRKIAVTLVALAACSSAADTIPTLTILAPARGTVSDSTTVTVTGVVTNAAHVTVNGSDVAPASDGTFTATVDVGTGIGIIETHALDTNNHDIKDVHAVLAGSVGTTSGTVAAPICAHVRPTALATIGKAIGKDAHQIDFTTEAKQFNPVYNNGGCLGATVNITSVSLSTIDVALVPAANALDADVAINNVKVKLHANYTI